ncbi:hypothetical protein GCM10028803_02270 [Larkinella knui]|uniref:Uncharacterized protein n=1 Tax=Larkinella knui TaxID=2025310 RepID=A0A3P1CL63_9BACT|nr:hypothetical protein [Larkinella knui]RRB14073.1 hypothetical protein EHT87_17685 [Larkinella knui]
MKLKKYFILVFISLLGGCADRSFWVDDVSEKQTFIVKKSSPIPMIDPLVKVYVKGYLDGKALVYIPNGPGIIDDFYTIKLNKGYIKKGLSRAFTYQQFSIVYQPITAKSGHLEIDVDAP